ncbi:MAG: sugar-binding domain-containing protein [Ginsengibacter sp.]
MKKLIILLFLFFITSYSFSQKISWTVKPGKIQTTWADSVDPLKVLPDYPRPQMVRPNWSNLNGLWQYSILPSPAGDVIPQSFTGNILVPFAVESALSGVGKTVGKDSILWYQTTFNVPQKRKGSRLLLHFGAVDWRSTVYVNGKKVGFHQGGYDPFTVDVTEGLVKGSKQQLAVSVWDPTDEGPQPHGKQVKHPDGIWYTSVTGIWQTVWMEVVPETYITSTRNTPDIDHENIAVVASVENLQPGDEVTISAWRGDQKIAEKSGTDTAATLMISDPVLWSPSNPFLYDLKVSVKRNNKIIDEIKGYFAMRKISTQPDENGIQRMMLNNKFVFEFGPLDQGWWPDGLYTAPTDGALKSDVEKLKDMGFNMIRKHVKVEPARWYFHCDKIGMLVWQDMPSGDLGNRWESHPGILGKQTERDRTPESEHYYRTEWNAIINSLYNFPCIVVWVPFNEAWGQFKTVEITNWTKQKDPSRLVNSASGGNYYEVGDILDLHNYPDPEMPKAEIFGSKMTLALGEYGGLGLPVDGHTWEKKNWGYQTFKSNDSLFQKYHSMTLRLAELIREGLSAAIYTQTTDVETEVNGFMTYDRKVIKMPIDKLKASNEKLYNISISANK